MREEDVERLRRGYDALNEGGVEAVLDWLAPQIEVSERQTLLDRETYHGIGGFVRFFAVNMEAFEQLTFEPEEFIDAGDDVIVMLRQRARGRVSGAEVESRVAHLWTLEDGTPVRLRIFGDKQQAVEAARAPHRQPRRTS